MRNYRYSDDINSLVDELISKGYKELDNVASLGIKNTKVFASVDGNIATITSKHNRYELIYRQVKPIDKGDNRTEYRIAIENKKHPVHKIIALTYPEFTGKWDETLDIHHLDCNHLHNEATNLICVTKEIHVKIHSLLKKAQDTQVMMNRINTYLFACNINDEDITIEGLEELIYG